ncbi:MAG: pyridoxamine 5'-phosphate oxidase family protein [Cellulosilyticaceae bacterium]
MDFLKAFNRIMEEQSEIALATCVDNIPNVRVVNFYYDTRNKGVIYFSTFADNAKIEEFSKNKIVAFTSIPHEGNEHVRVVGATVKKSELTVYDLKEAFIKKNSDYEITIEQVGDQLILFEVKFEQADVTIDFTQSKTIIL